MKKLIGILLVTLMPTTFFGQAVFDKFNDIDDITAVIVNKKMFSMMGKVDSKDKDAQQFLQLVKKLDNLKVFTTSNNKYAADMKSTADKYMKSAGLEDLMRVSDKGQNVRIMVKTGSSEDNIRELLMFIEGSGKSDETVLLSLTGNFDLNEISLLTDKMNLPGGSSLAKASKSN